MTKMMMKVLKEKAGWLEIVEAFVAVLLVAGVILILLNRPSSEEAELSNRIYEAELSILKEIQRSDILREKIVLAQEPVPIEWSDPRFPPELKDKIIERSPDYLTCIGEICNMTQTCVTDEATGEEVYSQSIGITSILENVTFRKVNLFCWTK